MQHYYKNPRKLSPHQRKLLKESLEELGDLSGIIHDVNSDQIIGGNQRSSVININKCKIEIINTYDKPTSTGTIAEGFVIWKNERYAYRKVKWTEKQCERANISANAMGGDWDIQTLLDDFKFDELEDWGMDMSIFESEDPDMDEGSTVKDENDNEDDKVSFHLTPANADKLRKCLDHSISVIQESGETIYPPTDSGGLMKVVDDWLNAFYENE